MFSSVLDTAFPRNRTNRLYKCVYKITGSCSYGSWQVPRFSIWVGKLETRENLWLSFSSSLKARGPGRFMVPFQPESQEAQSPRRAEVSVWVQMMSGSKAVRQEKLPLTTILSVLFRLSTDGRRRTLIRKGNPLHSVYQSRVNLIQKQLSQTYLGWCLTKWLGTTWPSPLDK